MIVYILIISVVIGFLAAFFFAAVVTIKNWIRISNELKSKKYEK